MACASLGTKTKKWVISERTPLTEVQATLIYWKIIQTSLSRGNKKSKHSFIQQH